eukprot:TRINITY_DN19470_c0_g4_i2.p1 TRINITY_DN19470_c0_g4~~TRINITY_DN19470_c0_g4_i2.p1  ORF type:complete len:698 (+),score=170.62 TRINITY_DN19470_c0_g4_i2:168-2261(+)
MSVRLPAGSRSPGTYPMVAHAPAVAAVHTPVAAPPVSAPAGCSADQLQAFLSQATAQLAQSQAQAQQGRVQPRAQAQAQVQAQVQALAAAYSQQLQPQSQQHQQQQLQIQQQQLQIQQLTQMLQQVLQQQQAGAQDGGSNRAARPMTEDSSVPAAVRRAFTPPPRLQSPAAHAQARARGFTPPPRGGTPPRVNTPPRAFQGKSLAEWAGFTSPATDGPQALTAAASSQPPWSSMPSVRGQAQTAPVTARDLRAPTKASDMARGRLAKNPSWGHLPSEAAVSSSSSTAPCAASMKNGAASAGPQTVRELLRATERPKAHGTPALERYLEGLSNGSYAAGGVDEPLLRAPRRSAPAGAISQASPPMVVALDVDEVLVAYMDGFRKWLCYQRPEGPHDTTSVFHEAHDPVSPWRLRFAGEGGLDNLEAVPGAAEALARLRVAGVRLEAVTSRPPSMRSSTEALLLRLYPADTFAAFHFVGGGEKGKTCRSIGAVAIVDDQLPNVIDCSSCGVVSILFNLDGEYPWSHCDPAELPSRAYLAESWEVTCEYLFSVLQLREAQRSANAGEGFPGALNGAYAGWNGGSEALQAKAQQLVLGEPHELYQQQQSPAVPSRGLVELSAQQAPLAASPPPGNEEMSQLQSSLFGFPERHLRSPEAMPGRYPGRVYQPVYGMAGAYPLAAAAAAAAADEEEESGMCSVT